MKILYTNIQSVFSKINELIVIAVDQCPDIILLTETWCNTSISDATLAIPGYQLESDLRRDRTDTVNGLGGGLLVYTKQGLKILPHNNFKTNEFNQFCSLRIPTKGEPLTIFLVYRPPGSGYENTDKLCEIMTNLDKQTILIGDFNFPDINWIDSTSAARGRPILETATSENLEQLVNFSTHNKGNILDLVLTNCPEKIVSIADGGKIGKSDHCILNIEVKVKTTVRKESATRLNWTKADIQGLQTFLGDTDWHSILSDKPADEAWETLRIILDQATSQFVPRSTIRPANTPKWLTREIIKLVRKKKRAWKLSKTHGTTENINRYKELEKELIVKLRNAKRSMEKKLANSGDTNAKKFANYIRSKTKSHTGIGPLKNASGKLVTDDKEMAEELNSFFSSVYTDENINNIPARAQETNVKLDNIVFTIEKIRDKIKNLKANSAPGPDGICTNLLQNTREELLLPLKIIFEKTLNTGTVPQDWRHAVVTPIFKKGTKGDPANYRPVSLTSIPCKIFESIIKDCIMKHLLENNLIKESQHGFMPGRSCATNLIIFMDKLTEIVDRGKPADIFYLDFAKAFDKVPRARLLQKMERKGISGKVLNWVENWLTGRTQAVKVGNVQSNNCEVKSGVPQGSVLGPPLFTIFIDDLDDYARVINLLSKFADDTKGLQEIQGEEDRDKLQRALDGMMEWAEDWGMQFNVDKCKIMHIGRNNPQYEYKMGGKKLKPVEEEKDIGVTIHHSLKPSTHCKKVADIASAVLRQLAKNFHYRDRHIFKKLYVQYVRPHVEFASPAWSPWNETDKAVIEKVQIKAVNMISGLAGKTYEEKCLELGLETLEERRKKQDLLQTYKICSGKDRVRPEQLFDRVGDNPGRETHFTADPQNIVVKRSRLDIRKNSFALRTADDWNSLSNGIKTCKTATAFKNAIKPHCFTGEQVAAHMR